MACDLNKLKAELDAERKAAAAEEKALGDRITKLQAEPVHKGTTPAELFGGRAPWATSGPVGKDSAGYSVLKAAGVATGLVPPEQAKEEIETARRLKELMGRDFRASSGPSFLVPTSTELLPTTHPDGSDNSDARRYAAELRQKMAASYSQADPDEAAWMVKKGLAKKAAWSPSLGTLSDTAGGVLVGFPTLGELVDLQRNMEVFTQAGCSEQALPPNGRLVLPKLTNGATAYNIPEAQSITQSQPTTGSISLEAKKIGIIVPLNNDLIRYAGPTAEAMVRGDMARVGALKMDLDQLTGTGGTQILGLLKYPTTTSWSVGTDKVILHTASTTGADGDTFQPKDMMLMDGKLPDVVDQGTAWVVRKDWFANIVNRQADAVTAGDGKGPFLFDPWRSIADKRPSEMGGVKVIRSRQVPNDRTKGSGTGLTLVIYGYFKDWIVARMGVMEFLANPYDSSSFQNDQVALRGIQIVDAAARHPASFCYCDTLLFA